MVEARCRKGGNNGRQEPSLGESESGKWGDQRGEGSKGDGSMAMGTGSEIGTMGPGVGNERCGNLGGWVLKILAIMSGKWTG